MQESSEQAPGNAQEFLASLRSNLKKDLCSENRKARGKAINRILRKLDSYDDGNKNVLLQSFPVAMIQSHEYMSSIYFIEKCIRSGEFFDPKTINAVINGMVIEKLECINDGDSEAATIMTQILHRFYNTILSQPKYQKEPEIYLSIGTNVEQENDIPKAIDLYNEAIGLGSIDGYFCAATAYESLGDYTMSASILDAAYQISGEERFLHRYIHALCKSGKREEAYTYYRYLQSKNKNVVDGFQDANKTIISPFIVYSEAIHSDNDLHEFELLMTAYHVEGTLEPSMNLRDISVNASVYIANEIEKESHIIEKLNLVSTEVWNEEQDIIYWQSIKRRLYLMQMHIITIQDPRYMEFYLREMRQYTIEGNANTQRMMMDFFTDSFSEHVYASCSQIIEDIVSNIDYMHLMESMRLHLVQIRKMYSQSSYYMIIRDTITPFIEACLKIEGKLDDSSEIQISQFYGESPDHHDNEESDENEEELHGSIVDRGLKEYNILSLKKENADYEGMNTSTRKMYEEYVEYLDKKYGMFYRRTLQQLARDKMSIPSSLRGDYENALGENGGNHYLARNTVISNMQIFLDYPDIALFLFLEKILLGQDYLDEGQTMESFIMKYHLESLSLFSALLFASILYENEKGYDTSEYITHVQGMFNIPQALYMLIESIRYMDKEDKPDEIIKNLDTICREEYEAEGFFEHFTTLAQDIFNSDNPDDDEIGYILLASANMKSFQGGNPKEIIAEFEAAGDHGLMIGYISAGDILEEKGIYSRAMEYYNKAYLLSPNIITIRRILNILLLSSQFDEAWEYIDMAIRDGHDVAGYISAWHLYQGNNKEAMEELCKIIQSNGRIDISFPESYTDFMLKTIESDLSSPDISIEQSNLTILASYIRASFTAEESGSNPADYVTHVEYIEWLVNAYKLSDISNILLQSIPIFTGDIGLDKSISIMNQSSGYLHLHLLKIHAILVRIHQAKSDTMDTEARKKTFNLINSLSIIAVQILKKFPDSEKYCTVWEIATNLLPTEHDRNKTIHRMPEIIQ